MKQFKQHISETLPLGFQVVAKRLEEFGKSENIEQKCLSGGPLALIGTFKNAQTGTKYAVTLSEVSSNSCHLSCITKAPIKSIATPGIISNETYRLISLLLNGESKSLREADRTLDTLS